MQIEAAMTANPRPRSQQSDGLEAFAATALTPQAELEHLLKVANSISHDASATWMEIWNELRECVACGDKALRESQKRFLPSCGWGEFVEKLWLLKHYLDSIQRVTTKK